MPVLIERLLCHLCIAANVGIIMPHWCGPYPYLESGVELDQSSGRSPVTHLRLVFTEQEAASASHGRGLLNSPQICVICSDCV